MLPTSANAPVFHDSGKVLVLFTLFPLGLLLVATNDPSLNSVSNITDITTQSMMNATLSQRRFWLCYENGLITTIPMTPSHN